MKSVIFCQAPAKIGSVLNCYDQELSQGRDVTIVVRNVYGMYLFFKDLNLKANLLFFEPIGQILNVFYNKSKVAKDIEKLKLSNKEDRIYFTDTRDDPTMGFYLSALKRYTIIKISQIAAFHDNASRGGIPLKYRIKEKLLSWLYNYSYKSTKIDHWTLELNTSKYNYPTKDFNDLQVFSRYKIVCNVQPEQYAVFFTEPYRNQYQTEEDYDRVNQLVIDKIHAMGLKVAVKGHPRIGCHHLAEKMCDYIIPEYIPSEFLDVTCFKFAIGFVSTSLCSASEYIKAYTVVPLCEIIDENLMNYWMDYIHRNQGRYKVDSLKDFNELF